MSGLDGYGTRYPNGLHLPDNASLKLGDSGDITIKFDGTNFNLTGGAIIVGVNDSGHDVKFYGATSGKYFLWDESEDTLSVLGKVSITQDASNTAQPLIITATSASTSGSNSMESMLVSTTLTGAGGVGGRARFALAANAALGGWANALKAITTFGATGSVTGLGSAACAELVLSAGTTGGSYAPIESELVLGSGAAIGTATSFLYGNVSGDAADTFLNGGFLFELGSGCTIDTGHVVQAAAVSDIDSTHAIRIRVAGTTLYIPAHTSATFAP